MKSVLSRASLYGGPNLHYFAFIRNEHSLIISDIVRRSFIRGGGRPLAVFRRAFSLPPALRPRHGPVRNSPLPWGLYYIFIEPSLAGGFLWQGADTRSSYKTADPYHLSSTSAALTTPRCPQSGCDAVTF